MERAELGLKALEKAEIIAQNYFRAQYLRAENKLDQGFDPVTQADREIEALIRSEILAHFTDDSIIGEEADNIAGCSGYEWIIDPIDGTRAFIIGAPSFAILMALRNDQGFQFAAISQPHIGERFLRIGNQAYYERDAKRHEICVSSQKELAFAKIATTFPEIGSEEERQGFNRVRDKALLTRYGMDAYAYALLAMGQLDLVIEAGLKPFDYASPWAVIEAAGGVVMNWEGRPPSGTDRIIAAASRELVMAALAEINR